MNFRKEFFSRLKSIDNYKKVCELETIYFQHGETTVLRHSRNVAYISYIFAKRLEKKYNISFNYDNLIKGAFLHDFFIYDWHEKSKTHRLHGFTHPVTAGVNAKEICNVSDNVVNIIQTHMWPLTLRKVPNNREALIVCIVDKYIATRETFKI